MQRLLVLIAVAMPQGLSTANPIVIELTEADVIKERQSVSILVGTDASEIEGTFLYRRIPNFSKEREAEVVADHFKILIPVYFPIEPDSPPADTNDPSKVRVSVDGVFYETELVGRFTTRDMERLLKTRRPSTWSVPKGHVLICLECRLPIALLESHREIKISYRQPHVRQGKRAYCLYTAYFENHRVWESIGKNVGDYRIEMAAKEGLELIVDRSKNPSAYGLRDGKQVFLPMDHLVHCWAEVREVASTARTKR